MATERALKSLTRLDLTVAAAVLLLMVGVLATGYSNTTPKELPRDGLDRSTTLQIYTRLDTDPVYYYRHVNVSVHNGVATLSGYVWSTSAYYRAKDIAAHVPGVQKVIATDLQLGREGTDEGS